jgi:hypothetical protein
LEGLQGPEEETFDTRFLEREAGEGFSAALGINGDEVGMERLGNVVQVAVSLELEEVNPDEIPFEAAGAAETPPGGGELVDQGEVGSGGGVVLVLEGAEELVEGARVLAGEEGVLRGESVLEGVAGGPSLTLGGPGPCGKLRVVPVGFVFTFAGHDPPPRRTSLGRLVRKSKGKRQKAKVRGVGAWRKLRCRGRAGWLRFYVRWS